MSAYWGVYIYGNTQSTTFTPSLPSSPTTGPGVFIIGTQPACPVLGLEAAASQTANLLDCYASNGSTILASISASGAIAAATPLTLGSNHVTFGSTAPSSGTSAQGDVCFNTGVTSTTSPGWSCTVSGTPGTWTAWPNL